MSILRIVCPLGQRLSGNHLIKLQGCLQPQTVTSQATAAISSKANMMGYQREKPFPYKERNYTLWDSIFDKTTQRFDENSKLVIVEGPIASGKSTLAKQLAEDLDMKHYPEANTDVLYVNEYGYDQRMVNDKVPEACQGLDIKTFYKNPKHVNVPMMQLEMCESRYLQYCEALAHIMNTGQGAVLERCIYSDFVFMEAMFESGYIASKYRDLYNYFSKSLKDVLLQPHLVIYLDVPLEIVKQRIKQRNNEWEVNTSVLTDKYLAAIEKHYKMNYLKTICKHAEVMVYDWSNYGDGEVVVEDIERIDFEKLRKYESKGLDWVHGFERDWTQYRIGFTNQPEDYIQECYPSRYTPELMMTHEESEKFIEEAVKVPGSRYVPGYNTAQGDSFWKTYLRF